MDIKLGSFCFLSPSLVLFASEEEALALRVCSVYPFDDTDDISYRSRTAFALPQTYNRPGTNLISVICQTSSSKSVISKKNSAATLKPFSVAPTSRLVIIRWHIYDPDADPTSYLCSFEIVVPLNVFTSWSSHQSSFDFVPWSGWGPGHTRMHYNPPESRLKCCTYGNRVVSIRNVSGEPPHISVADYNPLRRGLPSSETEGPGTILYRSARLDPNIISLFIFYEERISTTTPYWVSDRVWTDGDIFTHNVDSMQEIMCDEERIILFGVSISTFLLTLPYYYLMKKNAHDCF